MPSRKRRSSSVSQARVSEWGVLPSGSSTELTMDSGVELGGVIVGWEDEHCSASGDGSFSMPDPSFTRRSRARNWEKGSRSLPWRQNWSRAEFRWCRLRRWWSVTDMFSLTQCFVDIPRVEPPWLGTQVNPCSRSKWKSSTLLKATDLLWVQVEELLWWLKMDEPGGGKILL